jgi:hypothetical protein
LTAFSLLGVQLIEAVLVLVIVGVGVMAGGGVVAWERFGISVSPPHDVRRQVPAKRE